MFGFENVVVWFYAVLQLRTFLWFSIMKCVFEFMQLMRPCGFRVLNFGSLCRAVFQNSFVPEPHNTVLRFYTVRVAVFLNRTCLNYGLVYQKNL